MTQTVRLNRLRITDFRNHESSELIPDAGLVVLIGANGAGKTNLLEAVSFLSPGRGMRRAPYASIARLGGSGSWSLFANLTIDEDEIRIGTGIAPNDPGRKIRIDGEDAATSEDLMTYCRVAWLTPTMDGLFTGSAGDRRRFLDRLVLAIDPDHGRRVSEFERLMRGRNRLLEEGADASYLEALEMQIAERAVAVSFARQDMIARLRGVIEAEKGTLPFPAADLALAGEFEATLADLTATDAEDEFRNRLAQARFRDKSAGRMTQGPHRSDLSVMHEEKAMPAALSSTGEQKGLLISIFLAHATLTADRSGRTPFLLLDEIAAHLDETRRNALFQRLAQLGAQCFMTGTDKSDFEAIKDIARFLQIDSGTISEMA